MGWVQAIRWALIAALLVGGMWLAWLARPVLTPFLFAFVIAYLIAPLVECGVRLGIPRLVVILVIYLVVGGILVLAGIYLIPMLLQESLHLIRQLPNWTTAVERYWSFWLRRLHQAPIPSSVRKALTQSTHHLETNLFQIVRSLLTIVWRLVPGLISAFVAPILAFFVLKDLDRIRSRFWSVIPLEWRPAVFKLGLDVDRTLNGFIRGQLLVALAVGILSAMWTAFLGIPFAILIGALAAITDVLPYLGPVVGAIPAIILAFTISPWKVAYVVAGFIVIHQLEGTVIAPKVVGESVGLHPLIVIFALLVGGEVDGITGLLLAVPLTAVVKVVIAHLFRRLSVTGVSARLKEPANSRQP